jgi:hypothetical protein
MPSTPPLSPTSSRDAARHVERSNRIMNSPENRRLPSTSTPSINQHLSEVIPTDLTTRLSSIPPQDEQNGPHATISAIMLDPPPIITPMAPPAHPADRQSMSSAQLAAALAAIPSVNPPTRRRDRQRQTPVSIL